MSEITEVKTSIKKIVTIFTEIKGINSDSISNLENYPDKLLELVEKFEQEKNDNVRTIESNSEEMNNLKNKISQNNRDVIKFEETNVDLINKQKEITEKISKTEQELTDTQEKINSSQQELEIRNTRLKEVEEEIQELRKTLDEFENKIKEMEIQLTTDYEKKENYINSFENNVNAMKLLIRKKYIISPQLQLIQALQADTTLDLKNMLIALDIRENIAKGILSKIIEEGGPLEYDEASGKVLLKSEVDF